MRGQRSALAVILAAAVVGGVWAFVGTAAPAQRVQIEAPAPTSTLPALDPNAPTPQEVMAGIMDKVVQHQTLCEAPTSSTLPPDGLTVVNVHRPLVPC